MTTVMGPPMVAPKVKPDIEVRCGVCGAYVEAEFGIDDAQRVTISAPCAVCDAQNELTVHRDA